MSELANIPKNAKYIDYDCVICGKKIDEDERQKIIALGFVQTWCLLCAAKKFPADKHLQNYVASGGFNSTVIDRNKLLNGNA